MDEVLERVTRGAALNAPDDLPPAPPPEEDSARLRKPPHSIEAEQSVLGALLLSREAFAEISDTLAESDFFRFEHRLIFGAIATLISANHTVDVISVFENLQQIGKAEEVGGLVYLNQVAQCVPGAANIKRHAEIVLERADLRRLVALSDDLATAAFNPQGRLAAEILDNAKQQLGKLAEGGKASGKRVPILSMKQLREQAHSTQWLVKYILPDAALVMMFGASGTFKSFIALDAACHVAHGLKWLGRRTKQGSVLYLAAEGGAGMWGRVCAWHQVRRLPYDDVPLHFVPVALNLAEDSWRVVEAAQELGIAPAMVVVDTLSQTFGGEENSAAEVAAYFRELGNRFRQLWGCTVLIVHHSGHSATERPRGSSVMLANVDAMVGVFRDEEQMLATMTCSKQKDGDKFKDINFAVSTHVLGTDEDGDKRTSLVARHLSSVEDVQELMEAEGKAGRKGHGQLLLSLVQNGQKLSELRTVFYGECGLDSTDSRRRAFNRAKDWLVNTGLIEVSQGVVITLKGGT